MNTYTGPYPLFLNQQLKKCALKNLKDLKANPKFQNVDLQPSGTWLGECLEYNAKSEQLTLTAKLSENNFSFASQSGR